MDTTSSPKSCAAACPHFIAFPPQLGVPSFTGICHPSASSIDPNSYDFRHAPWPVVARDEPCCRRWSSLDEGRSPTAP